ncbi:hypothetical protein ACVWZV_004669 [Bradyrhizobium sp. GM5.1]
MRRLPQAQASGHSADEAPRLVRLDLVPFVQHAAAKFGIGVPERARRRKAVDCEQHFLDLRPVPVQRHRITPRGPGVAEADHAADIVQPERRVNDRQREDHVLAGVLGTMFLENSVSRNARRDHRRLDDRALGLLRARRHAAADNRPAEQTLVPQPGCCVGPQRDVLAGAEHEQQVGRPKSRVSIRCARLILAISSGEGLRVLRSRVDMAARCDTAATARSHV